MKKQQQQQPQEMDCLNYFNVSTISPQIYHREEEARSDFRMTSLVYTTVLKSKSNLNNIEKAVKSLFSI